MRRYFIFLSFLEEMKRPLYYRILEVENYREKFEKHFEMITPSLQADTFDNFSWEQIQQSMDHGLDVSVDFGNRVVEYLPYGLKEFISVSSENILRQLEKQ